MYDAASVFIWGTIIFSIAYNKSNNNLDKPHYKWYMRNVYANVGLGLMFGILYINLLGGGDTEAYYMGTEVMSNLLLDSPGRFFDVYMNDYNPEQNYFYNIQTGYPPGWICREYESFLVIKILTPICLVALKSYWSMTIIISFIASQASWKLYLFVREYNFNDDGLLAFGVLLLPSVNFWCSGVSKDAIVFIATIYLVIHAFQIISEKRKATLQNYIYAFVAALFIYYIRSFILAAILLPMSFALSARFVKLLGGGENAVIFIRSFILILGLAVGGRMLISSNNLLEQSSTLQQAAVIQDDFANNQSYGDKRYDIGTIEFTPIGLLRVTPFAVLAGVFKPNIWEVRSPTLLINGLESLMFIYFCYLFFRRKPIYKWRKIRGHEFLIFCVIFVFIIAFMTGLTSGLYGVLVRLRAPLLPFFFILLTTDFEKVDNKQVSTEQALSS